MRPRPRRPAEFASCWDCDENRWGADLRSAVGRLEARVHGLEGQSLRSERRGSELAGLAQALTEEQRALLIRLDRLEEPFGVENPLKSDEVAISYHFKSLQIAQESRQITENSIDPPPRAVKLKPRSAGREAARAGARGPAGAPGAGAPHLGAGAAAHGERL